MTTGRLLRWVVKVGDQVTEGDVVAEVETDKANMEIECLASGTIEEILAKPGQDLPVGSVLGRILEGKTESSKDPGLIDTVGSGEINATVNALRRAAELGLDVSTVRGTGPSGRVLSDDVEDAARNAPQPSATKIAAQPPSPYRFPGGFAMRARVSAQQIIQSLSHLEASCKPPTGVTWSREKTAGTTIVFAAVQALLRTATRQGRLERPITELALTLITPAGIEFFDVPLSAATTLQSLSGGLRPAPRECTRKAGTLEATVAIACGLESIEPLNPGDIHLSVSIAGELSGNESVVAISLITDGDSKLHFAVDFLNHYTSLLQRPLALLGSAK
jgi:hypothetical protein